MIRRASQLATIRQRQRDDLGVSTDEPRIEHRSESIGRQRQVARPDILDRHGPAGRLDHRPGRDAVRVGGEVAFTGDLVFGDAFPAGCALGVVQRGGVVQSEERGVDGTVTGYRTFAATEAGHADPLSPWSGGMVAGSVSGGRTSGASTSSA